MSTYDIAVVVGSLRRDSFNKKLAKALEMLAPDEMKFNTVEIGDLPDLSIAEKLERITGVTSDRFKGV